MDTKVQDELKRVLRNTKYRYILSITFDGDMIICHKLNVSQKEFEEGVGGIIDLMTQSIEGYGLKVVGRNKAGICLGDGNLRLKIQPINPRVEKLANDVRREK